MTDTVRLEVAASLSSLPVVRLIVGGVGSSLDLSLDDLEDVYLAFEELFHAATRLGEGPRLSISLRALDGTLDATTGPFHAPELRALLGESGGTAFDACSVLSCVVEDLAVTGADHGAFDVTFRKSRSAG